MNKITQAEILMSLWTICALLAYQNNLLIFMYIFIFFIFFIFFSLMAFIQGFKIAFKTRKLI